jgi:predicted enzyme related to lactoylglutathione lyase
MNWERTYQVGVVVNDLDEAIAHFERAGIGPFTEGPSEAAFDRRVRGESTDAEVRGALAQMGPIELELLQPVKGRSIQQEALEEKGEHALHLCAHTDDLQSDIERMVAAGFHVISEGKLTDGGSFAYFETRAVGGLVLEFHQKGTS